MSAIQVVIFCEEDGSAPLLEWMDRLPPKVQDKCQVKIRLLHDRGSKLRRPHADYLEEGIFELRVRYMNVQYRILYAFVSKKLILLSHGIVKQRKVPKGEIRKAIDRKNKYQRNPKLHTYYDRED